MYKNNLLSIKYCILYSFIVPNKRRSCTSYKCFRHKFMVNYGLTKICRFLQSKCRNLELPRAARIANYHRSSRPVARKIGR